MGREDSGAPCFLDFSLSRAQPWWASLLFLHPLVLPPVSSEGLLSLSLEC